ncbi:MAG: hypothetical protein A2268_15615 [Candidatus Raymondbacteria bacterium RifOxyA12_full_50_37]|uniref:Phosphotransferase system enzyme I N-terminal domain-containing protein n=1 Tax=Candidatus Raymondbacteria bacterium RIFOXYD12_FULL_49_13 TaxID=1817890 RepID=A0A1F7FL12_UNCRA|nr:MAG: hypothetical protein A2268_15615 [Candidatus Raymondbacteria bacterium RifOxyA12_full_50_37]OGJ86119.1 MAG: hypothetical protein A2248_22215 [Candidatus Raymondbacteria bacterium RIFOXYA2_FULL_49_16]OGJ86476.1 MAG: hypothetical protein A2350_20570 [Candidatus Raymondbacteria bacterium RifOxyB12_full_50_8]OGJ95995.1 MAG: hypothetical protein A2453_05165 [Candidatus Raymondbacteria bacterium RIFOXYC2_FULL_50_21]OGK05619.1 MAG: hypothetical protein A2487_18415 [Candidatus Raymondbacteria b
MTPQAICEREPDISDYPASRRQEHMPGPQLLEEIIRLKHSIQKLRVICQYSEDFLDQSKNERAKTFAILRQYLEDPVLGHQLSAQIKQQNCSAESAVHAVLEVYRYRMRISSSPYLRYRASDITTLMEMLIDALENPEILTRSSINKDCLEMRLEASLT